MYVIHARRLSRESEIRLGQKWLLIVGIVITVLAVGHFLEYSFDRNWVGPAGRVSLAYLAGLAILATGEVLRRRGFDLFGLRGYLLSSSSRYGLWAGLAVVGAMDNPRIRHRADGHSLLQ